MTGEDRPVVADFKRTLVRAFSISAACHLVAALVVTGFFHPDQHFQTLEWALEVTHPRGTDRLPWEYHERIRSWLQPYLYAGVIAGLDGVGIHDAFARDRATRLVTGALGFSGLILFCMALATWIPDADRRRWLALTLGLFWYFPFFDTRTGGEALSTAFLLFGIAALWLRSGPDSVRDSADQAPHAFDPPTGIATRAVVVSGVALGMAFTARYQLGIVIASMFFWLLARRRMSRRQLGLWVMAIATTVAVALLVDRLGYGVATLTPWRYVRSNLLDGRAATYGVEPWYYYFVDLARSPLGVLLIAAALLFWIRFPKHLFTWLTLPFVVVHVLLSHKELRFLTPLAPLVVAMGVLVIPQQWFAEGRRGNPFLGRRAWVRWGFYLFAAVNGGALIVASVRPLRPEVTMQRYILRHYPERFEFYSLGPSPYVWGPPELPMAFYAPRVVVHHPIADVEALVNAGAGGAYLFYYDRNALPSTSAWAWARKHCTIRFQSYGPLVRRINITDWLSRTSASSLYLCNASAGVGSSP